MFIEVNEANVTMADLKKSMGYILTFTQEKTALEAFKSIQNFVYQTNWELLMHLEMVCS